MVIVPKENQEETKNAFPLRASRSCFYLPLRVSKCVSACVFACVCMRACCLLLGALPEDYSGGRNAPPPPSLLAGDVTFRSNGTLLVALLTWGNLVEDSAKFT